MSCDSGKLLGSDPLVTDPIPQTPFDGPTITGGYEDFVSITDARIMDLELCLSGSDNLGDDAVFEIATRDAPALLAEIHRLKPFEQIVRELAERGPNVYDGLICTTCDAERPATTDAEWFNHPANHERSCLWRRARELYPQPVVS